jgi:hypothetical protein
MPEKCGLTLQTISHSRLIFAHIQVGGCGGSWGGGKARNQGEIPFMAKMWLFICQLSASQTSEDFLPKLIDVAFCCKF